MASDADGWVKLWRKLEASDIWELPPATTRIWVWILLHACHDERTIYGVSLEPGELFTSYQSIADGIRWKENGAWRTTAPKQVRWALKRLSERQALRHEPRQHGTWIKVLHWEEYQSNEKALKGSSKGRTNDTTTAGLGQDYGTKQEEKKEEDKKETFLSDARTVFVHWQERCDHPGAQLTTDRKRKLEARLREGITVERLCQAIDGCASSKFHMGENDGGRRYDSIELIFRNAGKVDEFADMAGLNGGRRTYPAEQEILIARALVVYQAGDFAEAQQMVPDELWLEVMSRA